MAPYTRSVKQSTMFYPPQLRLKHVAPSTTGNSYRHAISRNRIGPLITRDTPQNRQFYDRRIYKVGDEIKTLKNMGYEMALIEILRGT